MTCGIYRIRNTVNGKSYIGSGISIERRFRDHIRDLRNGTHCNQKLQRAWNKYGHDAFEFSIVQIVGDASNLTEIETRYIEEEKTAEGTVGYNICKTGRSALGLKRTAETCAKMSQALTGRVASIESRLNMSLAHKGIPRSEEVKAKLRGQKRDANFCAKISAALRTRPPISDETRAKLCAAQANQTFSTERRAKMSRAAVRTRNALGSKRSDTAKDAVSLAQRKLTDEQVAWVRAQRAIGIIRPTIAAALGVSKTTIRNAELKGYRNGYLVSVN